MIHKTPVILDGTQYDCKDGHSPVKSEYGHTLTKSTGAVCFSKCSAYNKDSVFHLFDTIMNVVYSRGKRWDSFVKKLKRSGDNSVRSTNLCSICVTQPDES